MEDIIETLKLKILFCFDNVIDEHLNPYNIYVGLPSNKLYTRDQLMELILAEFIASVKFINNSRYTPIDIFYAYLYFYKESDRHEKTGTNYEIYRLIISLCRAKIEESKNKNEEKLYYSMLGDITKLINLLTDGSLRN